MSLCKKQWPKKKKKKVIYWNDPEIPHWTFQEIQSSILAFFTGQKTRPPITQISSTRPSDSTQYVLLGQKDPGKGADVSTSIQVTTPRPSILHDSINIGYLGLYAEWGLRVSLAGPPRCLISCSILLDSFIQGLKWHCIIIKS